MPFPYIAVAMALAAAAQAKIKADAANRKKKEDANLRAAEIEAQPWTKQAPTTMIGSGADAGAEMLGGAVSGFAAGQSMDSAMASPAPAAEAPTANLDSGMKMGQTQTALGPIGGEGMADAPKASADYFNKPTGPYMGYEQQQAENPYPNSNSMWNPMAKQASTFMHKKRGY